MKILNITVFLYILGLNMINAQVNPIQIESDSKKITYSTSTKATYHTLYTNQPYAIKRKIETNVKNINSINVDFIEDIVSETTFNSITTTNNILTIVYYTNQTGEVFACSLVNYGYRVNFSSEEIENILSEAMLQLFNFEYRDNNPFDFYAKYGRTVKIN